MAKDRVQKGVWADLAVPGAMLAVRVTPNGRANAVARDDEGLRVSVTATPEDGKATAAVVALLAQALGVAKSRLVLVSGATNRNKLFRLDP